MRTNHCNELEAAAVLRDVHEWGGYLLVRGNRMELRNHCYQLPPNALMARITAHADDLAALLAGMCADSDR